MSTTRIPKFTLRFHDHRNHEILGVLADRFGMSKNQLAEEMLERELRAAALLLERDLTGTLEKLRGYRREQHLDQAVTEFAHAEGFEDDPIQTRLVQGSRTQDAFGIVDAFA
ncbi:MAG: hypothetical protein MSC31_09705 [Solirubrobacteraceae bacterium MAG38_C4-C5]|nr:hypothetical protein [Candidatus Siliceabacter maunaloa]